MQEGDQVSGGGGYHSEDTLSRYTVEDGVTLAMLCVDNEYGEVAVFNSGDDVEAIP